MTKPLFYRRHLVFLILVVSFCVGACNMKDNIGFSFADRRVRDLIDAIEREDLARIDELVAEGVDVNANGQNIGDPNGLHMTPLLWAYNHKKKEAFRRLIEHGADPWQDVIGFGKCTVLASAGGDDDSDWLRMTLANSKDLNAPTTPFATTVLDSAIVNRNMENLRLLVDAGADINYIRHDGSTAVIDAALSRWFEGVYCLLKAGADYRPKTTTRGYDLGFFIVQCSDILDEEQAAWREKVIDFLDAKGFDFEPAYEYVKKEKPKAAKVWADQMRRRAAEKQRRTPKTG